MPEMVDAILLMGYVDFSEGKWDGAIGWYEKAIEVEPRRPDAYLQLGDLYFRKGELAEARSWYERALATAPGNYTYIASLRAGVCALGLGDPEGAEQHLRRASESDPTQWEPLYRLACAESRQGDLDGALQSVEAAVAKGFADASVLQRDPCLRTLAADPRFQNLIRALGG